MIAATLTLVLAAAFSPVVEKARVAEIEPLFTERPALPCPRLADRAAWNALALRPEVRRRFIHAAECAAKTPPPALPDDLYLEFSRNGNRTHYERPYFARFNALNALALGEALENEGRFLPALATNLTAILDEKLWNLPAHDRSLAAWRQKQINVDLFASERAWGVALVVHLLGERLDPALVSRALARVRERAVDPYLRMARGEAGLKTHAAWWVGGDNNWNRVCHAGCCCAALLVCEDRRERAEAVALAEKGLPNYLSAFGADGYCEEGIGYWSYGFGNHLLLGLAVRRATGGKVDLFTDPRNRAIATYPVRLSLDEYRQVPLFADAAGRPCPAVMDLCAAIWPRLIPASYATANLAFGAGDSHSPALALFAERAFGPAPVPAPTAALSLSDWFGDAGLLVSRLDATGFAAVLKPLNRGFTHCHADAGSYALAEDGVMLAGDCGGEVYTSRTFSKHRFDSKVLNSYGHPVPVVEGCLQRTDRGHTRILSHRETPERDTLSVDLAPAYPAAKHLTRLVRTYVFDRVARTFSITDEVAFSTPAAFETALVTADPKRLEGRYAVKAEGGTLQEAWELIPNPKRTDIHRLALRFAEPVTAATVTVTFTARPLRPFPKSVYLDLMEKAVNAYTPERAAAFTDRNEREGVREHGFPRLTANLALLIAKDRQVARKDEVRRMLDICCRDVVRKMPAGTGGGNDFSVKELVFAVDALERAKVFPKATTEGWRKAISSCVAERIYSCQPKPGAKTAANWCVFGAASEQARLAYGMGGSAAFVERYFSDQLRFFDRNGMYMDPHQPMVYDFVTRLQFAAALACGYNGPSRPRLEELMDRSAELTLRMQSVSGEIPYGGRSNQFLHNEAFYAALCEGYAVRMRQKGDLALARRFRAAAERAVRSLGFWLDRPDVRHVKNRFPLESGYGCEGYAYFDKYMITLGSWAYLAYFLADDTIEPAAAPEGDSTSVLSDPFHRVVANVGDYTMEFDWNAQKGYDASGLGRFQRRGAPTVIALAAPFPTHPHYRLDLTNDVPLAIAPLEWKDAFPRPKIAKNGRVVFERKGSRWESVLSAKGLDMTLTGPGLQTLTVPAFLTDGETASVIRCEGKSLTVTFCGWVFSVTTNGKIADTGKVYGNRNGHSRRFDLSAEKALSAHFEIRPARP